MFDFMSYVMNSWHGQGLKDRKPAGLPWNMWMSAYDKNAHKIWSRGTVAIQRQFLWNTASDAEQFNYSRRLANNLTETKAIVQQMVSLLWTC